MTMGRRRGPTPLSIDELPDLYEEVREQAQENIDNHPPVPTLEVETERLWIEKLEAEHSIPEEDALELLKSLPEVTKLAKLASVKY